MYIYIYIYIYISQARDDRLLYKYVYEFSMKKGYCIRFSIKCVLRNH